MEVRGMFHWCWLFLLPKHFDLKESASLVIFANQRNWRSSCPLERRKPLLDTWKEQRCFTPNLRLTLRNLLYHIRHEESSSSAKTSKQRFGGKKKEGEGLHKALADSIVVNSLALPQTSLGPNLCFPTYWPGDYSYLTCKMGITMESTYRPPWH